MVTHWWESVWRSPMAAEFLETDLNGGLYLLADLHQARWTTDAATTLVALAKEIRLQEARFGLDVLSRMRLQWSIDKAEVAEEKRKARRPNSKADPRSVLKAL